MLWWLPHAAISERHGPLGRIAVTGYRAGVAIMISLSLISLVSAIAGGDLRFFLIGAVQLSILLAGTWHALRMRPPTSEKSLKRLRWSEYLLVAGSLVLLHIVLIYAKTTVLEEAFATSAPYPTKFLLQLPLHLSLFMVSLMTTSAAAKTLAKSLDENQRVAYMPPTTAASSNPITQAIEITIPQLTRRQEYALVIAPVFLCLLVSLASWALILGVLYRLIVLFDGWLRTGLPPTAQLHLIPASLRTKAAQRKLRRPEPTASVVEAAPSTEVRDQPVLTKSDDDPELGPGELARAPLSEPVDVRPLLASAIIIIALWLIERRRESRALRT